jgi:hypothetical protein
LQLTPHDDYEKWAITILVKFRDTERLQQLTAHRQSGGVRCYLHLYGWKKTDEFARMGMFLGAFSDHHSVPHEYDRVCSRTILVG